MDLGKNRIALQEGEKNGEWDGGAVKKKGEKKRKIRGKRGGKRKKNCSRQLQFKLQ